MTTLTEAVMRMTDLAAHLTDMDSASPKAADMRIILSALERRTDALAAMTARKAAA